MTTLTMWVGIFSLDRDGSAVELVGLCHSAVSWLARLHSKGTYPYSGVKIPSAEQGRPLRVTAGHTKVD